MESFKAWIEGFGLNVAKLAPDQLTKHNTHVKQALGGGEESRTAFLGYLKNLHKSNQIFDHDPITDRPWDFIRIEPLNKAERLNTLQLPDRDRLGSFQNAEIYYGFEFVPIQQSQGSAFGNTFDFQQESRIKELSSKIIQANQFITALTTKFAQIIDLDRKFNLSQELQKALLQTGNIKDAAVRLLRKKGIPYDNVIDAMLARWQQAQEQITSLQQEKEGHLAQIRAERSKTPVLDADKARQYLSLAQVAMMKILKEPVTKQDQVMQKQFVDLAVQHYRRFRGNKHYDYIVYPESSSKLNSELALAFAVAYNATPIQGIEKKAPGTATLDTHNASKRFDDLGLAHHIVNQMNQAGSLRIKHVPYPQYRSYMNILQKPEDLRRSGTSFTKRRLLLIDDNIISSGTIQKAHQVLLRERPKSIDIYVPLYGHHS